MNSASFEIPWIPFTATDDSKRPCPGNEQIEILLRSGARETYLSHHCFWKECGSLTITAWRPVPDKDGWIYWPGNEDGKCPLPDGAVFEVKFRCGETYTRTAPAWSWGRGQGKLIIVAYRILSTPKQPWTLASHLAKHFPSLDISKVHMADKFVEGDLEPGERPCLLGEVPKEGDYCCNIHTKDWHPIISLCSSRPCGHPLGFTYHKVKTRRPLPSTQLEPPSWSKGWHNPEGAKEPGEGYRFLLTEEVDGRFGLGKNRPSVADHYSGESRVWRNGNCAANHMDATYRVPVSTPFPDPPSIPAPEPGTPSGTNLTTLPDKHQPEPEQNTSMQTTQAPSTPDLPPVGSFWAVLNKKGDSTYEAEILAAGPQGVALRNEENKTILIEPGDWITRTKARILTKKELAEQNRPAAAPAAAGEPPKPGFIRRTLVGTAKAAFWAAIGLIFHTPIKTGIVAGVSYLAGKLGIGW